jgi:hypothetical protein
METEKGTLPSDAPAHEKPPKRRPPSRYDILIQCRDEAEQRELFQRLGRMGLKLRLLVL